MCVGFNASLAGNAITNSNHRAPLGKTGAHLKIFPEAAAQSVQTFGYFLSRMTCQVPGTGVNFDAWNDSRISYGFNKGSAVFHGLPDSLIIKDNTADKPAQPGSGYNHFPISAPGLNGLGNP